MSVEQIAAAMKAALANECFFHVADVSYAMPLFARLVSLAYPSSRAYAMKIEGGLYSLGVLSIPFNVVGLLFLSFAAITFNFPTVSSIRFQSGSRVY